MRLVDLRVVNGAWLSGRQALISDLVAALTSEGGEVRSYTAVPWSPLETGRYLVFRIPEGTEE